MIGKASPGDVVVNTKTKLIYNIEAVTQEGLYRLEFRYPGGIFTSGKPPVVAPDDPDYEVARRSASSTQSNLVARKEEIFEIVPSVSSDLTTRTLIAQLIKNEKVCPLGQHVFYNAAGPGARLLHRMGKLLMRRLHAVLDMEPPSIDHFEFLRLPAPQYDPRTLLTPSAFLADVFRTGSWSDHDPKRPVLSTNLSIFGDIRAGGSENSFSIFLKGGLFDVEEKKALGIFTDLLRSYRLRDGLARSVEELVARTLQACTKIKGPSAIYQIFLWDEMLDQVVYISTQSGLPLDSEVGALYGFKEKLDTTYGSLAEPRNPMFTREILKQARTIEYWSTFKGGNDPQARLIMNPNFFATPNPDVKILVFEPESSAFADYFRLLEAFDIELSRMFAVCIRNYRDELLRFQEEHAKALGTLRIDMTPEPTDLSISILTDMVNSLPAVVSKIQESGMSAFDFI